MRERTVNRFLLGEARLKKPASCTVWRAGKISASTLNAIAAEVEKLGVAHGHNFRVVLEVDEPEIVFPTGDRWEVGAPGVNCQIAEWRDGSGGVAIRCIAYNDGRRALFFKSNLGQYWQEPFSTELLRAIDWERHAGEFEEKP